MLRNADLADWLGIAAAFVALALLFAWAYEPNALASRHATADEAPTFGASIVANDRRETDLLAERLLRAEIELEFYRNRLATCEAARLMGVDVH